MICGEYEIVERYPFQAEFQLIIMYLSLMKFIVYVFKYLGELHESYIGLGHKDFLHLGTWSCGVFANLLCFRTVGMIKLIAWL